ASSRIPRALNVTPSSITKPSGRKAISRDGRSDRAALYGPHARSNFSPECAPTRTPADHSIFMASQVACMPPQRPHRPLRASALLHQVVLEDRHLELKRTVVVFVVDEQHA